MHTYPELNYNQLFKKGESIYIQKSTTLPKYIDKMHKHNFIEIIYIISGTCEHVENDISCSASKGDLFIINYGVPHANFQKSDSREPFVAYDIAFTPDFLDKYLEREADFLMLKSSFLFNSFFAKSNEAEPQIKLKGNGFYEFQVLFKNMLDEYEKRSKGYYDILRAYLIELLIKLFRRLDTGITAEINSKQTHYISLALQYIEANYNNRLRLEDISNRSFLSKSYFSQLFKEVTGTCFSDYIQKLRTEKACILLTTTDNTVVEIANQTGFCDIKFFYTIFKKITGYTPKEYRDLSKPSSNS